MRNSVKIEILFLNRKQQTIYPKPILPKRKLNSKNDLLKMNKMHMIDEFGRDISMRVQQKSRSTKIVANPDATIDEFGRDITLRGYSRPAIQPTIAEEESEPYDSPYYYKYRGVSWVDIQEEAELEAEQLVYTQLANERRALLEQGMYELEEGELLE